MEIIKDFPFGYWGLGEMKLAMGNIEEAIESHTKLTQIIPFAKWMLGYTYAVTGHREEAGLILSEVENAPVNSWNALGLAVLNGALGNKDEAYKWLTYEHGHAWVPWVTTIPFMQPIDSILQDDVRYEDYIRRLNIPE